MLNLAAVFELLIDGLGGRSFAYEQFVRPVEQAMAHPPAPFGEKVKPMSHQKLHFYVCKTKRKTSDVQRAMRFV
jgi:hypothetical protein